MFYHLSFDYLFWYHAAVLSGAVLGNLWKPIRSIWPVPIGSDLKWALQVAVRREHSPAALTYFISTQITLEYIHKGWFCVGPGVLGPTSIWNGALGIEHFQ